MPYRWVLACPGKRSEHKPQALKGTQQAWDRMGKLWIAPRGLSLCPVQLGQCLAAVAESE
jgi:hypothetical protein